jgi:hypothetical protein
MTADAGALRPARRTDDVIVREIGDELVAYALDTQQVTALDPVTATVWNRLDGTATIDEIASGTHLDETDVCMAVDKLDRAGLMASGVDRRRFIRMATALAGTASLVSITAPAAVAAGSNTSLALSSTCTNRANPSHATVVGFVSGNGFAANEAITLDIVVTFVPVTGLPTPGPVALTVPATATATGVLRNTRYTTNRVLNAGSRSYSVTATVRGTSVTVSLSGLTCV